jgi:hypothetical protein
MCQIGYNMARNLQSKLPASDVLLIQDINADATKRFMQEAKAQSGGATVKIAGNVREASENSVSYHQNLMLFCFLTNVPLPHVMSLFYR